MEHFDMVKSKVNTLLESSPAINVAEKVKVDKAIVVIGSIVVLVLFAVLLGGTNILIDMVGFIYPLYASIQAIESKTNDDDTLWLTYWIIFSMFKIFEGVADWLVSFIPFYFFFKVAFLIYCFNPTSKGAETVYNLVVKPYVVPLIMGTDFAKKDK